MSCNEIVTVTNVLIEVISSNLSVFYSLAMFMDQMKKPKKNLGLTRMVFWEWTPFFGKIFCRSTLKQRDAVQKLNPTVF